MFSVIPSEFQWILAFMIPLVREFNIRMLYRIMIESCNMKLDKAKNGQSCVVIGVNAFTALYVAIKLGQTTTQVTSILILSIDFILNFHSCLRIIKMDRSTTTTDIHYFLLFVEDFSSNLNRNKILPCFIYLRHIFGLKC